MPIKNVSFKKNGFEFSGYPFPPASVYPSGLVGYDSIREVIPHQAPPEIRTKQGEVLFVPAPQKKRLLAAAKKNGIPVVSRVDVWSFILQPFLDTQVDDSKALAILGSNGVGLAECRELRRNLRDVMYAYNILSGLWDWCHLGLACVLEALHVDGTFAVCHQYALSPDEYRVFYHRAMEIAERGRRGMDVCPSCCCDLRGNASGICRECGSEASYPPARLGQT